jgi:hypothetical protein
MFRSVDSSRVFAIFFFGFGFLSLSCGLGWEGSPKRVRMSMGIGE